jgi:hypothetical protein
MTFGQAVLGMTLEHYPAFLLVGGLATLLFSKTAGPNLINAGLSHTLRGLLYGFVTLAVSFAYEYYAGMKDLFQVHAVAITVVTLWTLITLCLGVVSVHLWQIFRNQKSLK